MTDITAADINALRTTLEVASQILGCYHKGLSEMLVMAGRPAEDNATVAIKVAQIDVDWWRDKAIDIQRALTELHARRTGAEIAARVFATSSKEAEQ